MTEKLSKRDFDLLGRLFLAEVENRLPAQVKSKRLLVLQERGYCQKIYAFLGGRFPVKVEGWALTLKGHYTYCSNC